MLCYYACVETIPPDPLETSEDVLSAVDTMVQRRDGPRRLRDHTHTHTPICPGLPE